MFREILGCMGAIWSLSALALDTDLILFRPFVGSEKPLIQAKKSGSCLQASQYVQREDAWRCTADGQYYDPCFVNRFGTQLEALCIPFPWAQKAVQIIVDKPLDNRHHKALDMSNTFPWAVELPKGTKCWAIHTDKQYDDLPIRYRCDDGTVLVGHIQRCQSLWKILQHGAIGASEVAIIKAWF